MSWQINLVSNTLKLSKACIKELTPILEEDDLDPIHKGQLQFNMDHSEHMDYLTSSSQIREILQQHNVSGIIRFIDAETGMMMWEHRFDNGEYSHAQVKLADVKF